MFFYKQLRYRCFLYSSSNVFSLIFIKLFTKKNGRRQNSDILNVQLYQVVLKLSQVFFIKAEG